MRNSTPLDGSSQVSDAMRQTGAAHTFQRRASGRLTDSSAWVILKRGPADNAG